jgi:hypothetical protein
MVALFLGAILAQTLVTRCLVWIGDWLAQPPCVRQADAIVVLSGNMDRMRRGIELYHQGLAPELWHTGDLPNPSESTSFALSAAQLAVENGVPARSVHLLETTSTWEDGQRVVALAQERNVVSILVVTDWYHSRRALSVLARWSAVRRLAGFRSEDRLTRDMDLAIHYVPAKDPVYTPENWWRHRKGRATVLEELAKMCFYWLRYGVSPWYSPV